MYTYILNICIYIYAFMRMYVYIYMYTYVHRIRPLSLSFTCSILIDIRNSSICFTVVPLLSYVVALVSRIDKITGLFCKRAL